MTAREALRSAVGDFYGQSWRLFALNAGMSVSAGAIALVASFWRAGLLLVVLLGPLAAALMHCAVTIVRTDDLRLAEAATGLRLHWRRGLEVGALWAAIFLLGSNAVAFYGRLHGLTWPLAFLSLYVLLLAALFLLLLLALAVAEPALALRQAAARTLELAPTRPRAVLGLGVALMLVNAAGVAAALMPFLTLTVAYTFLAAARFAIPTEADA